MPDRERNDKGRFSEEYPRNAFESAIRSEDGLASTGEIAEHVGCTHDTAYKKLQQMEQEGVVTSRKIGNSLAWSLEEI